MRLPCSQAYPVLFFGCGDHNNTRNRKSSGPFSLPHNSCTVFLTMRGNEASAAQCKLQSDWRIRLGALQLDWRCQAFDYACHGFGREPFSAGACFCCGLDTIPYRRSKRRKQGCCWRGSASAVCSDRVPILAAILPTAQPTPSFSAPRGAIPRDCARSVCCT